MRGKNVILHLVSVLLAGLALSACISERLEPLRPAYGGDPVLNVAPRLLSQEESVISGRTKAKDDDDPSIVAGDLVNAREALRENIIASLDVFVKESDAPAAAPWFKEYHLKAGDSGVVLDPANSESLLNEAEHLLSSRWTEDGYELGTSYDIYVTANNDSTHVSAGSKPGSLSELNAMTTYSYDIFRYYLDQDVAGRQSHTRQPKLFVMDGSLLGWTVDPDSPKQVFHTTLRRAAAKIIVNISYSDVPAIDMVSEDGQTIIATEMVDGVETDVEYTGAAVEGKTPKKGTLREYLDFVGRVPGHPAWKYVNFGFRTSDVAGGDFSLSGSELDNHGDGIDGQQSLQTYGSNFQTVKLDDESVPNLDSHYRILTYSYPLDWSSNRDKAPYILYSIAFTKPQTDAAGNVIYEDDGVTPKQNMRILYYRIPVCNESVVSSLDRNNIYIVNAEIASLGSSNETLELPDEQLRIEYHVIPWTETEMSQEATVVKAQDIKYLTVSPIEYTLKGDDTQAIDLLWYASVSPEDGRFVDLDHTSATVTSIDIFYTNYQGNEIHFSGSASTTETRGTITKSPANPDGNADIVYTCTAPNNTYAKGENVIITVKKDGIIRVESEALKSRAVKTIKFRVKLNTTGLYDDVTIRHFPLDNIQSIEGSWSSRWDEQPVGLITKREYSFNPAADGWTSWDGYEDDIKCTQAQYNRAEPQHRNVIIAEEPTGTPSDYDRAGTRETIQRSVWTSAVPQNSRQGANSEANAYKSGDYWYWGTGSQDSNSYSDDYDWSETRLIFFTTYYRYTTLYRRIYYKNVTTYTARRYYRDVQGYAEPSTGNWVDWDNRTGTTSSQGIFTAKVFVGGYCRSIYENATGYNANSGSNLTNNHMYVIQITSTSATYVLGVPTLDGNYQSQDHVVSPTFMMASQLGAVTTTGSATTAATHCGTYMEVGTDGTRYVGWRLPTAEEINVIIAYQNGEFTRNTTMVEVLGGKYYWTLNGTAALVSTGSEGTATNAYVRCVRDLSTAEIKRLNGE